MRSALAMCFGQTQVNLIPGLDDQEVSTPGVIQERQNHTLVNFGEPKIFGFGQ